MMIPNAISPKWDLAVRGLDEKEIKTIHSALSTVRLERREVLFRESEPVDLLYILREGRVRLYQTRESGSQFTFGVCFSGALLGLAAFVLNRPGVLSAQAMDTVTASVMRRADFFRCMEALPRLQSNILELLAMLALESIERSAMALDPASARLGSILLRLAAPGGRNVQKSCQCEVVGLSQEELGRMIGASRTWVGLTLTEFERRGLVKKSRGRLHIPDADRLERAVADMRNAER